jgi:hypothetical protein
MPLPSLPPLHLGLDFGDASKGGSISNNFAFGGDYPFSTANSYWKYGAIALLVSGSVYLFLTLKKRK